MEKETLEFAKKFESVWKKLRERGLFEGTPEELFLEVLETARKKLRHEELLEAFVEVFGEDNLEALTEEIRNLRFLFVKEGILEEFEKKNKKKILEFAKALKISKTEALFGLFNAMLEKIPKDLSLWMEFERLRKERSMTAEEYFNNILIVEKEKEEKDTELIPVSGKFIKELSKEARKLPVAQRQAIMDKLTKRVDKAIESTLKEVKQKVRKLEKKKK